MPTLSQATYNTFIGGLITEAGPLTFPENASVDELNCDLLRNGARRRRLGLQAESGAVLSTLTVQADTVVTVGSWEDVAEQAGTQFAVVQVGRYISFYQFSDGALSAGIVKINFTSTTNFQIDLNTYARPNTTGAEAAAIEVTSIKGGLVVASPEINTFLVKRNTLTGAFTVEEIKFRIRDFRWMGNRDEYKGDVAIGGITPERLYDTKNAGWDHSTNPLKTYNAATGRYPRLTHPWFSGLNSKGDFKTSEWRRVPGGDGLLGNGKYTYDLYSQNRGSKASGVPVTTEAARFSSVAAFSGRVFFTGMANSTNDNGSRIYFSQLLIYDLDEIGNVLQQNDPTSRDYSDLLDTDGGFISIPEAHQIRKIHVFGAALLVFAANGVWRIGGVDDVFRATEYTVTKIGEDGLLSTGSFVSAQGRPYWWSNTGIFTVQASELGIYESKDISISTVQSFFDGITPAAKGAVRGVYDTTRRRIMWMFPDNAESNLNKRNRILLLDEELGAFFPWRIEDQTAPTDYLVDGTFFEGVGAGSILTNVVDSDGDQVVDSLGNDVVIQRTDRSLETSGVYFLTVDGPTGKLTFSQFRNIEFEDWAEVPFQSYAETGYNFAGELTQLKNFTYLVTYLRTTETGFTLNESTSGYDPVRPSSLRVSTLWDFRAVPHTAYQQAYRLRRPVLVDTANLNTFPYPETVVTTRLKMRGRGRSVRLRFESDPNKDFYLLGYEMLVVKPGKY